MMMSSFTTRNSSSTVVRPLQQLQQLKQPRGHRGVDRDRYYRRYHRIAIARALPDSFPEALCLAATAASSSVGHNSDVGVSTVSLSVARAQHASYLEALRKHVPVLCLPALESHPDCLFVEDTVVAIGKTAVLTRPGHVSRRGEVSSMRDILLQLNMHVHDDMINMRIQSQQQSQPQHDDDDDETTGEHAHSMALCDGGDVLYTGRHLFVGLSTRTNRAAFRMLHDVFGSVVEDVLPVSLPSCSSSSSSTGVSILHLKSAVTHLDSNTLLVPEGTFGDALLQAMHATKRNYAAIRLPNILACNAVVIASPPSLSSTHYAHVLAQDVPCVESKRRLEQAAHDRGLTIHFVNTREFAKKDAALTCCSVLLEC